MTYKLSLATPVDIPEVLYLMRRFMEASPYRDLSFDAEGVSHKLSALLADRNGPLLVLLARNEEDKTVGFIAALAQPLLFTEELVATEIAWWVDPEYRKGRLALRLLEALHYWAKLKGCVRCVTSLLVDGTENKLNRVYQRFGYTKTEISYMRNL